MATVNDSADLRNSIMLHYVSNAKELTELLLLFNDYLINPSDFDTLKLTHEIQAQAVVFASNLRAQGILLGGSEQKHNIEDSYSVTIGKELIQISKKMTID